MPTAYNLAKRRDIRALCSLNTPLIQQCLKYIQPKLDWKRGSMQRKTLIPDLRIEEISTLEEGGKPTLALKGSFTEKTRASLSNTITRLGLLGLGLFYTHQENAKSTHFQLNINGDRKIIWAIKAILQLNIPEAETRQLLIDFKEQCEARHQRKVRRPPPPQSKLDSNYQRTNQKLKQSTAHTTSIVSKPSKDPNKPDKFFIYKENRTNRPISEIEAFNADCYRLLLGARHPKVHSVHNNTGERTGNVSAAIMGFIPLRAAYTQLTIPYPYYAYQKSDGSRGIYSHSQLADELNRAKFMDIWAAAYVEEEEDLHEGNYGLNADRMSVKIDDDRSTWPLTAKYALDGGVDVEDASRGFGTAPNRAFPITSRDIRNFPYLIDAKPRYWIFTGTDLPHSVIDLMLRKTQPHLDKYQMFLKRALIPDSVYEALGNAHFRNEKLRAQFVSHKCARTKALRETLVNTPAFRQYLRTHHETALKNIKNDFDEYNRNCKPNERGIPLEEIYSNLTQLGDDIEKADEAYAIKQNQDKLKSTRPRAVPITKTAPSGPNFFERHPWVKHALIGAAVGLAVVGALAIIIYTWGTATPVMLAAAKTIGIAVGIKSSLAATATGATIASTGIVSFFTAASAALSAGFKKLFSKKSPEKISTPTHTPQPSIPDVPPRRMRLKNPSPALQKQSIFSEKKTTNRTSCAAQIKTEDTKPKRRSAP